MTLIGVSCVGHPFDLTKTRLQTAQPGMYTGAMDVVKKALAQDGPRGYVSAARGQISTALTATMQSLPWCCSTTFGRDPYVRRVFLGEPTSNVAKLPSQRWIPLFDLGEMTAA